LLSYVEGGFAVEPEGVARNVARAVKTGFAGLSIEDSTGDKTKPLFDRNLAIARVKAARQAIDADNPGVLLTGRCEAFLRGQTDLNLLFGCGRGLSLRTGLKTKEEIAAIVKAVHPKPVNLLICASGLSLKEPAGLGVRRISVGGSLAGVAS
jgi:methylisocitrate lyase